MILVLRVLGKKKHKITIITKRYNKSHEFFLEVSRRFYLEVKVTLKKGIVIQESHLVASIV